MNTYLISTLLILIVYYQLNLTNIAARDSQTADDSTEKTHNTNIETPAQTSSSEEPGSKATDQEHQCLDLETCITAKGNGLWYCHDDGKCFDVGGSHCCEDFNSKTQVWGDLKYHCNPKSFYPIVSRGFGYLAVDSCPDVFNDTDISGLCENSGLKDSGPFVIFNNTVVFKNKYCALCNRINEFEYFKVFYLVQNSMYNTISTLPRVDARKKIALFPHEMLSPAGSKVKTCMFNKRTSTISTHCELFTDPVVISNDISFEDKSCEEKFDYYFREFYSDEKDWRYTYEDIGKSEQAMSVFFTFNEEVDENADGCIVWEESMRKSGKCKELDLFNNAEKMVKFYLHSNNSNMTPDELSIIGTLFGWTCISELSIISRSTFFSSNKNPHISLIEIVLMFTKTAFKHEVDDFFHVVQSRPVTLFIQQESESFPIRVDVSHDFPNITVNQLFQRYSTSVEYKSTDNKQVNLNGFSFDPMASSCSVWAKTINDFTKLVVQQAVCMNNENYKDTGNNIGNLVTYICFGISIVSLLCLIFLQRKFGLVTNIPSSNTENIAVSLLLSNSLFVAGIRVNVHKSICYIIGVFLHYLWLSVFVFMAIAVASIASSLTKLRTRTVLPPFVEKRKRVMLTILGTAIPLPVVAATIILDIYGPNSWTAGYGTVPCFPNNYPANLTFFTGPILLIITINLICLIFTICKVCAVRNETSNVRKLNPYNEAKIYLRMSALSGVLWFVGILDSIVDEDWLSFAFTIVCGLQGFFIALSNFTSERFRTQKETSRFSSSSRD